MSCCTNCHEPYALCCCPDPPQLYGALEYYWHMMNRLAQMGMALFPLTYSKQEAVMRCENVLCSNKAEVTHRFQDPRRGNGETIAYVRRFVCSAECVAVVCDELERQAQYARLVN